MYGCDCALTVSICHENHSKIHTIPFLMHQMRIAIIYISSAMLRSKKKMEIRNVITVKISKRSKSQCASVRHHCAETISLCVSDTGNGEDTENN
jgi:hypothetical protein